MKKIILLVESGSDVTPELARRYGIAVVPMHVSFGDVTKDDGDFSTEEIVTYFRTTGKIPQTSGCNPEDFVKVLDRLHAEHPEAQILYLAYSAVTTCSFDSARVAAEGRDYVTLLDTQQVSRSPPASAPSPSGWPASWRSTRSGLWRRPGTWRPRSPKRPAWPSSPGTWTSPRPGAG